MTEKSGIIKEFYANIVDEKSIFLEVETIIWKLISNLETENW